MPIIIILLAFPLMLIIFGIIFYHNVIKVPAKGAQGPTGPTGPSVGKAGPSGKDYIGDGSGQTGDVGDTGPRGPTGPTGAPGSPDGSVSYTSSAIGSIINYKGLSPDHANHETLYFGTNYTIIAPFDDDDKKYVISFNIDDNAGNNPDNIVKESNVTSSTYPQVGDIMIINCAAYHGPYFKDSSSDSKLLYKYNGKEDELLDINGYEFKENYIYTITYVGKIDADPTDKNSDQDYAVTIERAYATQQP